MQKEFVDLLNNLVKKGWKPWEEEAYKIESASDAIIVYRDEINYTMHIFRELVSIESWLWQFVCRNKFFNKKSDSQDYLEDSFGFRSYIYDFDGSYWLAKCSRREEFELPKFLLDNIDPNA